MIESSGCRSALSAFSYDRSPIVTQAAFPAAEYF
jgi:hypothetical protein